MFDLSLARGLDYYTGIIYEAVLKGELVDYIAEQQKAALAAQSAAKAAAKSKSKSSSKSKEQREEDDDDDESDVNVSGGVGTVAAGGRYDGLVSMFDKKSNVPCVGLSIGVERLFAVMEAKFKRDGTKIKPNQTQVFVVTPQKGLVDERLKLCQLLWQSGIKCEHSYKLNPKTLQQLQYCEDNLIPFALVIGEDEIKNNSIKIRNVISREEEVVSRDKLIETLKTKLASI